MRTRKNSKSVFVTAALALTVLAYAFLIFLPTKKAISEAKRDLAEKRRFVLESQRVADQIVLTESRLQQARDYVAARRQEAPAADDYPAFLGGLTRKASQAGVRIERLSPQDPVRFEFIQQHELELALRGPYAAVHEFLRLFEMEQVPAWIENLRLEQIGEDEPDLRCQINMTVFTSNPEGSG